MRIKPQTFSLLKFLSLSNAINTRSTGQRNINQTCYEMFAKSAMNLFSGLKFMKGQSQVKWIKCLPKENKSNHYQMEAF